MSYFCHWYGFGTNKSKCLKIKKGKNYVHN